MSFKDLTTTAAGLLHVVLNFITRHQKSGIHSTYTDNLLMLALNRSGRVIWISEQDAKTCGIKDNRWVELYNTDGALTARAPSSGSSV